MIVSILSHQERMQGGFTHRFEVGEADLTQAVVSTAQAITLLVLGAGDVVLRVCSQLPIPFKQVADGAFVSTAMTIGDAGSANRFQVSTELNENGTEIITQAGTGTLQAYNAAGTLLATFTPTAGKALSALDTGKVIIFAEIANLASLY